MLASTAYVFDPAQRRANRIAHLEEELRLAYTAFLAARQAQIENTDPTLTLHFIHELRAAHVAYVRVAERIDAERN